MNSEVRVPLLEALASGIFRFGTIVLVEFEAQSLWYEASYTLAAQALREMAKTDFHTFQHPPEDVRKSLAKMGLDVDGLLEGKLLRVIDSYTIQTGLGNPEIVEPYAFTSRSLRMSDWKSQMYSIFKESSETRLIHIDENDSVLTGYNSEAEVLDFFRRTYTAARGRGFLFVYSLLTGVHSRRFYNQFESFADVVLDFRSVEESGTVNQYARIRIARGSSGYNSKWRQLETLGNGEVRIQEAKLRTAARSKEPKHKLAAIMFTDIIGYSSLFHKNESLAFKLLSEHRHILRPIFSKHNGRVVKTVGDAFLVEFASAVEAVSCALEIQNSMRSRSLSVPSKQNVKLRIGIHLGDVIHEQEDVLGDAVNVASRIEPLARPGGVSMSEQVFAQIRNKPEFSVVKSGTTHLKNVKEPVSIYRIVFPWEQEEGREDKMKRRLPQRLRG